MKPRTVFSTLTLGTMFMSVNASAKPVDLVLRLKERTPIEELAKNVVDPSSARYQEFYSPEEIRELSAPTEAEYQAFLDNLKSRGFEIVRESDSRLMVTVRGEMSQIESTLSTKFGAYFAEHPGVSSEIRLGGVSKPLSIPNDLSLIESVSGLDQSRKAHPHYHATPFAGKQAAQTVSQADIKKNYGFNAIYTKGITGKGQHIAIATYNGFHLDDVQGFFKQSKISPAPAVDVVNFNGTAVIDEDSAVETQLDTEFSGMIAPGASIHVFTSAENSDAGELSMFTKILDDNRAKVVNYSWGTCETNVSKQHQADMDKVYARAVAQGVNIMVASGDSGAAGCAGSSTKKVADWPASSPNVVAVGGTTYGVSSSGKMAETAWSGSSAATGGSGGGISTLYKLPAYQNNFQSPYSKRSMPDVAFNANPATGENVWTSCTPNPMTGACAHGTAHWMNIGGTSMAAPQWTGFLALVNESRSKAKKSAIGFLNPIIYSLSSANRAKLFNDVTSGSNGYKAGSGWDAVTGWGSMQADGLLTYLTSN